MGKIKGFCQWLGLGPGFLCSHPPPCPHVNVLPLLLSLFLFKGKSKPFLLPGGVRLNTEMATGKGWKEKQKTGGESYQVGDGTAGLSDSNLQKSKQILVDTIGNHYRRSKAN